MSELCLRSAEKSLNHTVQILQFSPAIIVANADYKDIYEPTKH